MTTETRASRPTNRLRATAVGGAALAPPSRGEGVMNRQPIGYWVKLLDRLIDESFARNLAADRLTRRHWQLLNVLARGPAGQSQVDDELAPFLPDGASTAEVIDKLRRHGWVTDTGGLFSLTPAGKSALAALRDRVGRTRSRLSEGITEEQYAVTLDTLARMCANLGDAHDHADPRG